MKKACDSFAVIKSSDNSVVCSDSTVPLADLALSYSRKRRISPSLVYILDTPAKIPKNRPEFTPAMPPPVEANIQVVVRCRPLNEREERDNVGSILAFSAVRSRELKILTSYSDKNLSKKYTFDRVFAPEASQDAIYADVVAPMLDEVLKGYNCTIFAYGQTGTGKTYTMEGNLEDVEGHHHPKAGVIPRALYNLFAEIAANNSDTTVKLSCIELYNEELKDLLSPTDDIRKLKVYETKTGVSVQNAVEVTVLSAADALLLLQHANGKRKSASTYLNEHSSRSHAVYSVCVFTRETTETGEDVTRAGKLNLVDLAGSENIGRSGVENKRAREAGLINQSLLTLGRVINSLVEKSPHVPYRESKLTRLLQDSLGGRTKTCIIATISSSRKCLDETQSTLDYAHRAKNIRNKPEINQRVTSRSLMDRLTRENDLLRADLKAAQDKNGVFLSEERWNETKHRLNELDSIVLQLRSENDETLEKLEQERILLNSTRAALAISSKKTKELETQVAENISKISDLESENNHLQSKFNITVNTLKNALSEIDNLHLTIENFNHLFTSNCDYTRNLSLQTSQNLCNLDSRSQDFTVKFVELLAELDDSIKQLLLTKTLYSNEHSEKCSTLVNNIDMNTRLIQNLLQEYQSDSCLRDSVNNIDDNINKIAQFSHQAKENVSSNFEVLDSKYKNVKLLNSNNINNQNAFLSKMFVSLNQKLSNFRTLLGQSLNNCLSNSTSAIEELVEIDRTAKSTFEKIVCDTRTRKDQLLELIKTQINEFCTLEQRAMTDFTESMNSRVLMSIKSLESTKLSAHDAILVSESTNNQINAFGENCQSEIVSNNAEFDKSIESACCSFETNFETAKAESFCSIDKLYSSATNSLVDARSQFEKSIVAKENLAESVQLVACEAKNQLVKDVEASLEDQLKISSVLQDHCTKSLSDYASLSLLQQDYCQNINLISKSIENDAQNHYERMTSNNPIVPERKQYNVPQDEDEQPESTKSNYLRSPIYSKSLKCVPKRVDSSFATSTESFPEKPDM